MDELEKILSTEYSEEFDKLRKDRVLFGFYKYGACGKNYKEKLIDPMKTLEQCLKKYKETGNTEYLVDAANYTMFEYMYPQHENGHFRATNETESAGIVGMSINEIKAFKEDI